MPTSEIFLTYKRKLPLSRSCVSQENGCHGEGPSGNPVSEPDNHDPTCDEQESETQLRSSLIFPGCFICGVRGNLLQCRDCHQPYHYECLDKLFKSKHSFNTEMMTCGCKISTIQTPSRLKKGKVNEGSDRKLISVGPSESPIIRSPEEGTKSSPCLEENKSHHGQVSSCAANVESEGKCASDSTESLDLISTKVVRERSCLSVCDTVSCSLKEPNLQGSNSPTEVKVIDCLSNFPGKSNLVSLITFSRRGKRKKDDGVADLKSPFDVDKTCSFPENCSKTADNASGTEVREVHRDSSHMSHRNQDKIGDDSSSLRVESALETKTLKCEEELYHGSISSSKDGSFMQNQLEDAAKNSSEPLGVDTKDHDVCEVLSRGDEKATVSSDHTKAPQPHLNLSIAPDSSHTVECHITWELGCQNIPNATSGSLHNSTDSISRSHVTVSEQASPSPTELLESRSKRGKRDGESSSIFPTIPLSDTSISVEDPKDKSGACHESENKCLQLFLEEKGCYFDGAVGKPEDATCTASEESRYLNLGSFSNQMLQNACDSQLDLGLSLPTGSNMGTSSSKKNTRVLPMGNFDYKMSDYIQGGPQSSSNQAALLLRHKLMLDRIVNRASSLNSKAGFQEKLKPYTTLWSEEELDFLWIGVRRHGRNNWHAMLKDPRLRFSSWRTSIDLAEQWEEEQVKLLNATYVKFKSPSSLDFSLDNSGHFPCLETRAWRENFPEETRLSLGDVYAHRTGGRISKRKRYNFTRLENDTELLYRPINYRRTEPYPDLQGETYSKLSHDQMPMFDSFLINSPFPALTSKGNLPHWLSQAVNTPLRPMEATLPPSFYLTELRNRVDSEYGGANNAGIALGKRHEKADISNRGSSCHVSNPDNFIVIDTDASSEETISDDHSARPL